jgi:hypothetical protein
MAAAGFSRAGGLALLVVSLVACGGAAKPATHPFVSRGGEESGPGSRSWGDGSSGPAGMHVGCIRGRRFAVLVTVHNRTGRTITLLGGGGPQPLVDVIERVAVQVRLAPPPPKGDAAIIGLRGWLGRSSPPVAIPPGRDGWVQSNFLMRDCSLLAGHEPAIVNRSITLGYSANGTKGTQVISVRGARIILIRGPVHPTLPINRAG